MKRLYLFSLIISCLFLITACESSDAEDPDFVGTWVYSGINTAYDGETNVYTATSIETTGPYTATFEINTYDVSSGHLKVTCTATSTGGPAVGTVYYNTYTITDNTMYIASSELSYPIVSTIGAEGADGGHLKYTRQ
jgi:hypothetical protein